MPLVHGSLGFGQTFATSTYGTTVTAGGVANTKGTVVELMSATVHDAHWVEIMVGNPSSANSFAIDLLIGASTEAVLIPNLTFRGRATNDGGARWLFPLFIPKGSRLAVQSASTAASGTCLVAVNLFNAGIGAGGFPMDVDQYGTITSSLGVNVDPGAVAHTDATVEITSATVRPHNWLVLTIANTDAAFTAATKWLIDLCVGSATEQAILSDWPVGGAGTTDVIRPETVVCVPAFVPQGSRLSVRARCSVTTDGDRDLFVTIHGA